MVSQHPKRIFDRAVELVKGGARPEAEALCRQALEQNPGDINFVALLGWILAESNKLEESITEDNEEIEVEKEMAEDEEDS